MPYAAIASARTSPAPKLVPVGPRGDDIRLPGFGTFEVWETAEKQGRNPRTGETVTIAAGKQPKFKAGAALKSAVAVDKASA